VTYVAAISIALTSSTAAKTTIIFAALPAILAKMILPSTTFPLSKFQSRKDSYWAVGKDFKMQLA